jgi:hypothetical protein
MITTESRLSIAQARSAKQISRPVDRSQAYLRVSLPGRILLLLTIVLALVGCATTPGQSIEQLPAGGGSISPEAVAQSFFDDLNSALDDEKLADDQQRGAWVERLAGYFAPNERDDQRIALRTALDSFTSGLGKLAPNEHLILDLKIDRLEQVEQTEDRAMIRPVNGAIYVLITRTTNASTQNLYEETVPLEKLIGNNGLVPVLRIGRSWYLTEG